MNYLTEWGASGVDAQLTALNVVPLKGQTPYRYLLYSEDLPRSGDGRLSLSIIQRYQHLEQGGWWCSGINPMTGEDETWGCFKPSQPRYCDGKLIKYEHPPKAPMGVFALRVTPSIWQSIAKRSQTEPPILQEEQSDLGFWQWLQDHPTVPLCITEGAKKAGALLTAGHAAIALPGINSGYRLPKDAQGRRISRPHLIPQLQALISPHRPIYIVFDQETKPNTVRAVNTAIRRMGYLLQQAGGQVYVVTWNPELGKGVDDLLATWGQEKFDRVYNQALCFDRWKAAIATQLTAPRSLTLHTPYLPSELPLPATARLIGIKSPKGTGKTQLLAHVVEQAKKDQKPILVISHRVQLVESLAARFGLPALTTKHPADTLSPHPGYILCIDSLHPTSRARFDPQAWDNALVIIDEVEQVLWHGLNSSTCRHHRVAILKTLKALMQKVLGGTGQVWAVDADLSDIALDYLMALSGIDPELYLVENQWKPCQEQAWQVYSYTDKTPEQLVQDLENHIAAGGRPMVCLSAQKRGSQWGTITLETYFQQRFPHRRILRIDSESLADPTHPAYGCMEYGRKLDDLLSEYEVVLASPAIETGVSIDLRGHFTSVWAIAQGIQSENSVRQALARVRENVPRYLWVAPYGFNRVGNGSTSLSSLLSCEHRLTQVNIRLLQQSDFAELDGLDLGFQAESLMAWAKLAVRFNGSMARYREQVIEGLKSEGHQCQEAVLIKEHPLSLKTMIDRVLAENYQAECEAISDAMPTELARANDIPSSGQIPFSPTADQPAHSCRTQSERRRSRHQELWQKYRIPVTPEIVSLDDRGWYEQLQYHYFLTLGRPYLADRDAIMARQSWFLPDFNGSQLGPRIATMELLGIPGVLRNPQRILMNTDKDLQHLGAIALGNRQEIHSLFGIGLAKNSSPIMIVRRFLALLGYGLHYLRCTSTRGEPGSPQRLRMYQLVTPTDPREQVFQQWWHRDQNQKKKGQLFSMMVPQKMDSSPVLPEESYQQLSLFTG